MFSEEVIVDVINFEMSCNGQVFLVNNCIVNFLELKVMIFCYILDCWIVIGYGQMELVELEQIIFGFVNYDYDVLIVIIIIESGIDILNVNMIIINQV